MDGARRSPLSDRDMSDGDMSEHRVTDSALTNQGGAAEPAPFGSANRPQANARQSNADLTPVADQLIAIAEQLRSGDQAAAFASLASAAGGTATPTPDALQNSPTDVSTRRRSYALMARKAYDVRRTRGTFFGDPDLFGEPAWDILLDLYVAHVDDKSVSVSSAYIGSAAPPTTGLRWLGVLAEQGLILREQDPEDQRRVLVRLSDTGLKSMDRYFEEAVKRGAA